MSAHVCRSYKPYILFIRYNYLIHDSAMNFIVLVDDSNDRWFALDQISQSADGGAYKRETPP
jgi:hypothetical protein